MGMPTLILGVTFLVTAAILVNSALFKIRLPKVPVDALLVLVLLATFIYTAHRSELWGKMNAEKIKVGTTLTPFGLSTVDDINLPTEINLLEWRFDLPDSTLAKIDLYTAEMTIFQDVQIKTSLDGRITFLSRGLIKVCAEMWEVSDRKVTESQNTINHLASYPIEQEETGGGQFFVLMRERKCRWYNVQ